MLGILETSRIEAVKKSKKFLRCSNMKIDEQIKVCIRVIKWVERRSIMESLYIKIRDKQLINVIDKIKSIKIRNERVGEDERGTGALLKNHQ